MDKVNSMPVDLELIQAALSAIVADYHKSDKVSILKEVAKTKRTVEMMCVWQQSQQPEIPIATELEKLAKQEIKEFLIDSGIRLEDDGFYGESDSDSLQLTLKDLSDFFISGFKAALQQKGNNNSDAESEDDLWAEMMATGVLKGTWTAAKSRFTIKRKSKQ